MSKLSLLAACLAASSALAQDLTIKAPAQSRPIVIAGATVHTVSGETIENGFVYFIDGVIQGVGSGPPPRFAAEPHTIDAAGKHVYPGLIGPFTQLGLSEIQSVRATIDSNEVGAVTPEVHAAVAVNPDSTLIPVTRSNGVLAVGAFPTGGTIPGRASVMQLEGWTWNEMTVKADAGLLVNWPFMRTVTAWWMDKPEDEQLKDIRANLDAIDEAFDTAAAYLAAKAANPALPTDLRWEAMRAVMPPAPAAGVRLAGGDGGTMPVPVDATAATPQLPVFISAQDLDQITSAVTWAVGRGLRPVIVGGRDAPLCADLLTRHDVPVIVQGTHSFPKRSDSDYDAAYRLPAELERAGIRWCLGTSDDTAHERNLPYNAAIAVAHGLDRASALRGITLSAAEILGVGDRLGSIDTGKDATLLITDGDPLEVTTRVERAFISGREIDLSNKHTKLEAKYREKYRQMGAEK